MIRHLFITAVCLLVLSMQAGFIYASDCTMTGNMVYMQLVSSDSDISPFVWGGFKQETTAVAIAINENNWERVGYGDKEDLFCYMPELVKQVRENPARYIDIPKTAPVYKRFLKNVTNMPSKAWVIITGGRGPNGTILDHIEVDGRTLR